MSTPDHIEAVDLGRRRIDHPRRRESDVSVPAPRPDKPLRREGDSWLERWMATVEDLARLKASHPMLDAVIDEQVGRRIHIGESWLADFASCNYLGLDLDRDVIDAVPEYLAKWGTHPSWSRLLGSPALYEEIEDTTAAQPGAGLGLFAELADGMRLGADCAGAPGRSAERVGRSAAIQLLDEIRSGAVLDRFASDQFIAFAALADGRTRVRLGALTDHVRTGLWLVEVFGLGPANLSGHVLTIDGSRVRGERHSVQPRSGGG